MHGVRQTWVLGNHMTNACHTLTYSCPQSGQLTPIDLIVEERFHRAAPGGMGGTKAAGNYSPVSDRGCKTTATTVTQSMHVCWGGGGVPRPPAATPHWVNAWSCMTQHAHVCVLGGYVFALCSLHPANTGVPGSLVAFLGRGARMLVAHSCFLLLITQVLVTQLEAKKNGFSDVVYLDAKSDT